MEKLTQWITDKFQHPLSLLFFLLGSLLILLGTTTSLTIPFLQALVPDTNYRIVSISLGVLLLLIAIAIYYRPPNQVIGNLSKDTIVKDSVDSLPPIQAKENVRSDGTIVGSGDNFTRRLTKLSKSQKSLLAFIVQEYSRHGGAMQETIHNEFGNITEHKNFTEAEIFYRLEQLCLLNFLEKQSAGRTVKGDDTFFFKLSAAYSKEIGAIKGDFFEVKSSRPYRNLIETTGVSTDLRLEDVFKLDTKNFVEDSVPQKLDVQYLNKGEDIVQIVKVMFSTVRLSKSDISSSYRIGEKGRFIIPFDRNKSEILPGEKFKIEIELANTWKRDDFDRLNGNWGYLAIDVVYKSKPDDIFERI